MLYVLHIAMKEKNKSFDSVRRPEANETQVVLADRDIDFFEGILEFKTVAWGEWLWMKKKIFLEEIDERTCCAIGQQDDQKEIPQTFFQGRPHPCKYNKAAGPGSWKGKWQLTCSGFPKPAAF